RANHSLLVLLFCLCKSIKDLFLQCSSGGVPELRMQRYDFFLNRQNFSRKIFGFHAKKLPELIYVKGPISLYLYILSRANARTKKGPRKAGAKKESKKSFFQVANAFLCLPLHPQIIL
ncbi:MAG: hypothetical protein IJ176_03880, partial [Prevotella sp.]|nr:hypothetical protein [Prevotella sp.]